MDLFGDLPEPERAPRPSAGKEAQGRPVLFEDLPPASSTDSGSGGPLLFDDLPPAASGNSGSQVVKTEGKGAKRKAPEEEKNGGEELVEKKVCKASSVIFGLKGYVAERKGEREEMQDAHVILNDITQECNPPSSLITRVSYFAVFDGHGGIRASKFAAQNLHQNLIRKFPKGDIISVEKTVKRCLLDTFKHTDEEFLKQASSQDGRVLGVLEVSRSIGDGQYKRCGVTSVPDIRRCQLTPNDRFILLACDGLFKVFTPEEAVNFILSCLEDDKIQTREGKPAVDARYEAACNRLANKAVQRGSADNVTVMVVRIGH
ncbi:integrin-linked kinase-associated serine/threonine phosphatase 2C isoform X9 [Mus musculus]|uniref:integrin-linked kinase-associated serine/threonine phosphatase 2C isoform X9 n=1 Tax=Mus musculus TaxID=10090 RepID=UPI001671F622|nr:integrin-linked kinase-associated serine/threonine phosphatase 2C isoform X9 [Mus musculus]